MTTRISLTLKPVPPFRLDLTVWALRRLPVNMTDRWDGMLYTRVIAINGHLVKIDVSQKGPPERPLLYVVLSARNNIRREALRTAASDLLAKVLGLRRDMKEFYLVSSRDNRLKTLAVEFTGMKPPRFPSVFEAVINSFACQQVSLNLGIILLNRLASKFGKAWEDPLGVSFAFPEPADLAGLEPGDLRPLGFSTQKGRAITDLASAVLAGTSDLESLSRKSDSEALEELRKVRGIGRWSAEYVLLRGLGRLNMLPGDDVGAQRNIQAFMHLPERPDYDKIRKIAGRWRPYSGLVYFHFLLRRLKEKGYLR